MNKFKTKIFLVLIIILVPILIHIFYSIYINDFIKSRWFSGDMLSYCATILAALIAFGNARTAFLETQKLDAKPYISLEKLLHSHNGDIFSLVESKVKVDKVINKENNANNYIEYKVSELNFIFEERNRIWIIEKLTDEQIKIVLADGNKIEKPAEGVYFICDYKFCYLPLVIENVGKGCAINMNIGIRLIEGSMQFNNVPHIVKENKRSFKLNSPFNFNQKDKKIVRLVIDNPKNDISGLYELIFEYDDIYNNHYEQNYKIEIDKNNEERFALKLDLCNESF